MRGLVNLRMHTQHSRVKVGRGCQSRVATKPKVAIWFHVAAAKRVAVVEREPLMHGRGKGERRFAEYIKPLGSIRVASRNGCDM